MLSRHCILALLFIVIAADAALSQNGKVLPPGRKQPFLRLEANGPTSRVTSLVFHRDKDNLYLYAAGLDKVVRVWKQTIDPKSKKSRFQLQSNRFFRIPIGTGLQGAINSMALSPDGNWLAVGGVGVATGSSPLDKSGIVWPISVLTEKERMDHGLIFVFNTSNRKQVKVLRGHTGPVSSLAFSSTPGAPLLLVSFAKSLNERDGKKFSEVIAWDVAKETAIQKRFDLPYLTAEKGRPELGVFHYGANLNQARSVIALGDGAPRRWDIAANSLSVLKKAPKGKLLALMPDGKSALSAHFKLPDGQLTAWDVNEKDPAGKGEHQWKFEHFKAEKEYVLNYPMALSLVSSAKRQPLYAATVLWKPKYSEHDQKNPKESRFLEMELLKFTPQQTIDKSAAKVRLWDVGARPKWPALAADPSGQFLAVSGNASHQIWVYSMDELLTKAKPDKQILQSIGETMRYVAFCKNNKAVGLKISTADSGANALIFDFEKNKLTNDPAGWQETRPEGKWSIEKVTADGIVIKGNAKPLHIKIQKDGNARFAKQIKRADLTSQSPSGTPLLAAAVYDNQSAESAIEIYRADTGVQIRRFSGHLAPIHSLAFSPDGKLLASAAADQTVAVWTLANLKQHLGKHGRLPRLKVTKDEKEQWVLGSFDDINDLTKRPSELKPGMVVEGIVIDKKLQELKSAQELYDQFWNTPPGKSVQLKLKGRKDSVAIEAAHGIDDQKPLFYLFVSHLGKANERDWVGWTPDGYFDLRRAAAGELLGWHYNNDRRTQPASFATLQQFRDRFYKDELLKHLIDKADIDEAVKEIDDNTPAPVLEPSVPARSGVTKTGKNHFFVRDPQLTLRLDIHNYRPRLDDFVEWQKYDFDTGKWQPNWAKQTADTVLFNGPTELSSKPAIHRFKAILHQQRSYSLAKAEVIDVRYQPPRPSISIKHKEVVTDPKYDFHVSVKPGTENREALVRWELFHPKPKGKNGRAGFESKPSTKGKIDGIKRETKVSVALKLGMNKIRVMARHKDALENFEENETQTLERIVVYKMKPPPPKPRILLKRVVPLRAGSNESLELKKPGEVIQVDVPEVRIQGEIVSPLEIKKAFWVLGNDVTPFLQRTKRSKNKWEFDELVSLEPGRQSIEFFAETGKGAGEELLGLVYQPMLPSLDLANLPNKVVQTETIDLVAGLRPPAAPSPKPFRILVTALVNSKEAAKQQVVSSDVNSVSLKGIRLLPDRINEVEVRLQHDPNGDVPGNATQSGRFAVFYVQKLDAILAASQAPEKKPFAHVSALIRTPIPLDESLLKITAKGKVLKFGSAQLQKTAEKSGRYVVWKAQFSDVPLAVGSHTIQLSMRLFENVWHKLDERRVVVEKAPVLIAAPEIDVRPDAAVLRQNNRNVKVRVQVTSKAPLKLVRILDGKEPLFEIPQDDPRLKPNERGIYVFEPTIPLDWGANELVAEVHNTGKPASKEFKITLHQAPVAISVDKLELVDLRSGKTKPIAKVNEEWQIQKLQLAERVLVHGRVDLNEGDARQHSLEVYVNNYRQWPAKVNRKKGGTFTATLMPNAANNAIELTAPSLKVDSASNLKLELACAEPPKQHLQVFILVPKFKGLPLLKNKNVSTEAHLVDILKAKKISGTNYYRSSVYDTIRFRQFFDTGVDADTVADRLELIEAETNGSPELKYANYVVLIYYQGKLSEKGKKDLNLWTRDRTNERTSALSYRYLEDRFFRRMVGAHLMWLEVARKDQKAKAADGNSEKWLDRINLINNQRTVRVALVGNLTTGKVSKQIDFPRLLSLLQKRMPPDERERVLRNFARLLRELPFYDQFLPPQINIRF